MITNTVTSVSQEIYEELGDTSSTSIAAIASWVRRNIGGLNNLLNTSFIIQENNNFEIAPDLSDIEKYIFKKMYSIYYFDLKIKNTGSLIDTDFISIKDDFGSVQKINSNEILKSFYSIRKQDYEELRDLVNRYRSNNSGPRQVAGDDIIAGSYSPVRNYQVRSNDGN